MAPLYAYKGNDTDGKVSRGIIEADTAKTARGKLKKQGIMVSEITEKMAQKSGSSTQISFFSGISRDDVALMTRQLASLVKSNIPLVEALTAMVEQTENEKLKVVLANIRQDVNEGTSLAKAAGKHSKVFDNVATSMIEAGESSGSLGPVLLRLAEMKEAQMRLASKLKAAMMYPILMMLISGSLMLAIFTFIIPKIAKVFEGMNKPMPVLTKVMINISDFIVSYWYLLAAATALTLFLFNSWKNSVTGKPRWDAMKLRAPLFGSLIRMIAITRFAHSMSTLLGSGVPILSAMNIAKNMVDSIPIANAITKARENITEGQSIADPLRKSKEFPPMMIHMISIGEKTGELPEMLQNVASTYENQVNSKIEGLTSIIEPIMIVVMGAAIGFIVLSVFLPLIDMSNISKR